MVKFGLQRPLVNLVHQHCLKEYSPPTYGDVVPSRVDIMSEVTSRPERDCDLQQEAITLNDLYVTPVLMDVHPEFFWFDWKHEPVIECNLGKKGDKQFCSVNLYNLCDHKEMNPHEFIGHEGCLMNAIAYAA